jgi:hypothetical protein
MLWIGRWLMASGTSSAALGEKLTNRAIARLAANRRPAKPDA